MGQNKYIISLDQGTTSSRAVVFDDEANIIEIVQKEFSQIYPKPGWVEHDPMEIYASQYAVLIEAIAKSAINSERDFRKTQQKISNNIENSLQMIA